MLRRHRLRHSNDIFLTRRQGKWVKHPLVLLAYRPNALPYSRFCFSASRRVGNAVQRNRAKRLLREALRRQLQQIETGWDCVWMARSETVDAEWRAVDAAVTGLLRQAGLLTGVPAATE